VLHVLHVLSAANPRTCKLRWRQKMVVVVDFFSSLYVTTLPFVLMDECVCVCCPACVWVSERERKKKRERERARACVCVYLRLCVCARADVASADLIVL